MQSRTSLDSWQALVTHATEMKQQHMSELFKQSPHRFEQFSIKLAPFLLDYSKNLINENTMSKLLALAKECDVEGWRQKCFLVSVLIPQRIDRYYTLPCVIAHTKR